MLIKNSTLELACGSDGQYLESVIPDFIEKEIDMGFFKNFSFQPKNGVAESSGCDCISYCSCNCNDCFWPPN
jgi:hypothetical protein